MTNVHGIKVTGGSFTARIWQRFMSAVGAARRGTAPYSGSEGTTSTPGLVSVRICPDTLLLATPRCPRPVVLLLDPARVPREACTEH